LTSTLAFYLSGFAWNFGLGMTYVLVPLYARSLGFSGVAIGALVSLPVLVQIWLSLVAGAYTDRLGGQRLAVGSSLAMTAAGIVFALSGGMVGLFVAQSMFIVSRAFYWPSTWAMAADLPGDQSRHFGRVNALASFGQIAGTAIAGLVVEWLGYRVGFWIFAAMGLAGAVGLARFRSPPAAPRPRKSLVANYLVLLRRPLMTTGSSARTSPRCRSRCRRRSIRSSWSRWDTQATRPGPCSLCAASAPQPPAWWLAISSSAPTRSAGRSPPP